MVQYPGISEYSAAVQRPAVAFADQQLKAGKLATNALGLPTVLGGGFALTYTVTSGGRKSPSVAFTDTCPTWNNDTR